MERATIDLYEREAARYERRRGDSVDDGRARAFARRVRRGGVRADLGCGPGLLTAALGRPILGLDASHAMLVRAARRAPEALLVQGDLEALPVRRGALAGAWARKSYLHVPRARLPIALAQLHHTVEVGAAVAITVGRGEVGDGLVFPGDDFPGRFFAGWTPEELRDLLVGAGFERAEIDAARDIEARAVRARSLPDTVGPGMRLLFCGLNPSLHAADAGVGYAGPGNRFWPAVVDACLTDRPLDPWRAFGLGVGMTDLVKRATPRAGEVSTAEFRAGRRRVERLVEWLAPRAICFVGLGGYRAVADRRAVPGWQPEGFSGVATYVMPSTSGLNARTRYTELVAHLREMERATR